MFKRTKIILQIETTHSYGRGLIEGIVKYSQSHGRWAFITEPPFYGSKSSISKQINNYKRFKPDGMIIREPKTVDCYLKLGIPLIVSPNKIAPEIPCIQTDAEMIGKMAADYFIKRGFEHFAFCGFKNILWSSNRLSAFVKSLNAQKFAANVFLDTVSKLSNPLSTSSLKLQTFIQKLPKPVAIMCCNDDMGKIVIENCKTCGVDIPGEAAVLGVDNDNLVCELTDPPLSSIYLDSRKAGFEAASLLDKLIKGEKTDGQIILHQPEAIITRRSSDIYAVEDEDVLKALSFISANCRYPIQSSDVAVEVGLSERQLFTKFKSRLNSTVHSEIKRMRIEKIKQLLRDTDLSITQIAYEMGFTDPAHICRYFKKLAGCGLGEYRNRK